MKRHLDLEHTADAIDLVHFLEQRGVDSKLVPLHKGTTLEVVYDEEAEQEVEEWLSIRHAELAHR